jgi:CheY-like chemotaxis protein
MANSPNSAVKILLADDSVTMHRAVSLGLKKEPFEVLYCDNGQDALRLIRQHRPLIVLADLDMPGMTGAELCQAIKTDRELARETKVILLCGSFDQVDESKIDHIPADARLWKPFESHVLVSMLHTLLKIPPKIPQEATLFGHRPAEATMGARKIEKTLDAAGPSSASLRPPPPPPPPPPISGATMAGSTMAGVSTMAGSSTIPGNAPLSTKTSHWQTVKPDPVVGERTLPAEKNIPVDNLWSDDFRPSNAPMSGGIEETIFPEKIETEQINSFEIVSPTNTAERTTSDFSSYREEGPASGIPGAASFSEEEVRQIVKEEVERAVNGYLKDKLQERLQDVLKMIDRYSKA